MENTSLDLENLRLSKRGYRILKNRGINTIIDLIRYLKVGSLQDLQGFGKKSSNEVYDGLVFYISDLLEMAYSDIKNKEIVEKHEAPLPSKETISSYMNDYIDKFFYNIPVRADYNSIYVGNYKVSNITKLFDRTTSEIFLIKSLFPYITFKDIGLFYNISGTSVSNKFKFAVNEIRRNYFLHKFIESYPVYSKHISKRYKDVLKKVDSYDISNMYIITNIDNRNIKRHKLSDKNKAVIRVKQKLNYIHKEYKL